MQSTAINVPITELPPNEVENVITLPADIYQMMEVFCYFNPRIKPV